MIQTASLTGFLEMLLIILLVYYGVKFVSRLFGPYMLRYLSKKMQDQFSASHQEANKSEPKYKEGETVIDKMPKQETSSNKNVGEYIDYEEID